ncbi:MAG: type II toxin-antitoxin system MqsR family toxin [Candidatus Korobacteraceae bacterium]
MQKPSYALILIKGLMTDGSWVIKTSALDAALELGFDQDDVYDCIVNQLEETHFYKTMEAEKKPGLKQEVYHITYQGQRLCETSG